MGAFVCEYGFAGRTSDSTEGVRTTRVWFESTAVELLYFIV